MGEPGDLFGGEKGLAVYQSSHTPPKGSCMGCGEDNWEELPFSASGAKFLVCVTCRGRGKIIMKPKPKEDV